MRVTAHSNGTISEDGQLLPDITWSATDRFYIKYGMEYSEFTGIEEVVNSGAAYQIRDGVLYFNRSTKVLDGDSKTIYGTWSEVTYITSTSYNDRYVTEYIDMFHFNQDGSITCTTIEQKYEGKTFKSSKETQSPYTGSFTLDGNNRILIDWGKNGSEGELVACEYQIFCNHLCLAKVGGTEIAWKMAAP